MIDIQRPIQQTGQMSQSSDQIKKFSKMFGVILLVIIIVSAALVLWYFLRPTRTVTLAEGESYTFSEFTVTLNRVTDTQCLEIQGVTCDEEDKELGVQVTVRDTARDNTSFGYTAIGDEAPFEVEGLRVTAEEVNFEDKNAKIKLKKL